MSTDLRRVAVLGAGSWGTAFAKVMADAGREVVLWARRGEVADAVNATHTNPDYLPGVVLPGLVTATTDAATALADVDAVVFAVPSQKLRANLEGWRDLLPRGRTLVSLAKGVELGTLNRMSEVVAEVAGVPADQIAVVTGPNLAREIAAEEPTATVIACADHDRAVAVQLATTTGYFRSYTHTDVVGCEIGGAAKNVIALACGMASGMGFGDNTKASLITRGLDETARLGVVLGADPMTFAGLAGLGDLVATCSSPLSRNRTFGEKLGKGMTTEEITGSTRQIAEGVKSCSSLLGLAQQAGVYAPIVEAVHAVVENEMTAADMLTELISKETKHERD
jgi:glycerol-3-phosphate dehydrogenase (NAD(P)+)